MVPQAVEPHEIWQVDAVENVPLATGQRISWLTVTDEASGAILATEVSPPPSVGTCPRAAIQTMFRGSSRLGPPRPRAVDNGYPWGTPRDLPSELALWLIGLGVEPIWNPPGQPTLQSQGGAVQRPDPAVGRAAYLHRLPPGGGGAGRVGRTQREEYPAIRGQTRMEVFPQLGTPRRVYRPDREAALWDLARVDAFLAQGCWRRQPTAMEDLDLRARPIGRPGLGTTRVGGAVRCASRCWLVSNQDGELVKQFPANELTRERIIALAVSRQR